MNPLLNSLKLSSAMSKSNRLLGGRTWFSLLLDGFTRLHLAIAGGRLQRTGGGKRLKVG